MSILTTIKARLPQGLARDAWVTDNDLRAQKVSKYRRYVDGDYDANMTPEMRDMLRLKAGSQFGINYSDTVVQTMADRLCVTSVEADDDIATAWGDTVLTWNRFDGFQMDVHDAAIRDGDTFVMVSFDNVSRMPYITAEPAFDGIDGMVVVHERSDSDVIAVAIKIWQITENEYADTTRVNFYYPDRIERYVIPRGVGTLAPFTADGLDAVLPWLARDGSPLGVPVVQFSNRQRSGSGYGLSEIESVVPLQDALNRTLHSMVMAAELSAFQVRYAIGTKPPAAIAPGMVLATHAGVDDQTKQQRVPTEMQLKWFDSIRYGAFEQGEIVPFIEQAKFLIDQIRTTSRTPNPEAIAGTASGESRKQAEVGLIGKCKRFQTKAGNAWEDVLALAARIASTYSADPAAQRAAAATWHAKWKPVELRDDVATVDTILKLREYLTPATILRLTAPVTGLTENDIVAEVEAKGNENIAALQRLSAAVSNPAAFEPIA